MTPKPQETLQAPLPPPTFDALMVGGLAAMQRGGSDDELAAAFAALLVPIIAGLSPEGRRLFKRVVNEALDKLGS